MAKRKDSVALFEVITATKKREEAAAAAGSTAPSVLRTPKWWFKSKNKAGDRGTGNGEGYVAPVAASAPTVYSAPQLAAPTDPASSVADPTTPTAVQRVVVAAPERVSIPERVGDEGDPFGLEFPERRPPIHRSLLSRFGFGGNARKIGIDSDRREVTLKFRYTTAIVAGFAICVVVGLAYVTGRKTNQATAGPNGVSSAAIKSGPVLPHVLDIGPDQKPEADPDDTPDVNPPPPRPAGGNAGRDKPAPPPPAPRAGTHPDMPGPAQGVETVMPRVNGLNYVIIQSYPDQKTAADAQRVLEAEGIPCTVERGPKGWTADPDWHSVVGIHGFPRVYKDTPAYKNYVRAIESTSKRFAGNSKFKQFQPLAYKWK